MNSTPAPLNVGLSFCKDCGAGSQLADCASRLYRWGGNLFDVAYIEIVEGFVWWDVFCCFALALTACFEPPCDGYARYANQIMLGTWHGCQDFGGCLGGLFFGGLSLSFFLSFIHVNHPIEYTTKGRALLARNPLVKSIHREYLLPVTHLTKLLANLFPPSIRLATPSLIHNGHRQQQSLPPRGRSALPANPRPRATGLPL